MQLVIVESPTKAKTISHFLGANFKVVASYGHVRDLPKSKLGIDTEHQFTPTYIIPKKAQKHVTELKKLAQKADAIILATDEDREGEAIAWHLTEVLAPTQKTLRIAFHEITETAIKEALAQPRELNMNLVNAQQARRILDNNLVLPGYELILSAAHTFNLLDARGVISVTERANYIARIRNLAKTVAKKYYDSRESLGFPLLRTSKTSRVRLSTLKTTTGMTPQALFLTAFSR